jgi:ABC-type sugar transport system substrate-binding protein
LADGFLASIAEKVGEYCVEKGMKFIDADGEFNITVQIRQIENFIAMGADMIMAQPVDLSAFEPVITEARSRGIKILFIADDPPYDYDGSFMSVDTIQGQMVAEMASTWLDAAFPNAGKGEIKVAVLTMNDRPAALERSESIKKNIKADPRCTVVFEKAGLSTLDTAQTAMDECLALHKDINVVLCFDEVMALGANASVMADASLDKSNIGVFGGNITDVGYQIVAQSATNESVLRGLVTFGQGDEYYQDMADAIAKVLMVEVPINTPFFAKHQTFNTVGHESSFDPTEYAAWYVENRGKK